MKKIVKRFFLLSSIFVITSLLLNSVTVFAGGDSMGGRPEYTVDQINKLYEEGNWNNKVVFNSITDSVIGSEFDFVGAREDSGVNAGKDNVWNGRDIVAEDGKTYLVRMYVHNNGKSQDNWRETGIGVARDTHVFFSIPQGSSTSVEVSGFINSSNAMPNEYWDSVTFKSANSKQFHLEYVRDSAMISNQGIASGGIKLNNDVVDIVEGTPIGYDAMDGRVPGGYEYDNIITVRVKAVYGSEFTIQKSVRFAGTTGKNWTDNLDVEIGDELEYQIVYKNTGNVDQYNVMLRDVLPNNVEYIPGSTKFWNANYDGVSETTDNLVNEKGINIGNYAPGANAIIRFRAKVVDKNLAYGSNTIVNWGQGSISGTVLQDYANVHLWKMNWPLIVITILCLLIGICFVLIFKIFHKIRSIMDKLENL